MTLSEAIVQLGSMRGCCEEIVQTGVESPLPLGWQEKIAACSMAAAILAALQQEGLEEAAAAVEQIHSYPISEAKCRERKAQLEAVGEACLEKALLILAVRDIPSASEARAVKALVETAVKVDDLNWLHGAGTLSDWDC